MKDMWGVNAPEIIDDDFLIRAAAKERSPRGKDGMNSHISVIVMESER